MWANSALGVIGLGLTTVLAVEVESGSTAVITVAGIALTFLAVLINAFVSLRASSKAAEAAILAAEAARLAASTDNKVDGLTVNVDGRFTELLKVTKEAAERAGLEVGRKEGREEEVAAAATKLADAATAAATEARVEAARAEGRIEGAATEQQLVTAAESQSPVAPIVEGVVEGVAKLVGDHEHDGVFHDPLSSKLVHDETK